MLKALSFVYTATWTIFLTVFFLGSPIVLLSPSPAFAKESQAKIRRTYIPAKVIKTSYQRERSQLGNWRGRVLGQGNTVLFLRFIQHGKVVAKRLIGRVALENEPNGVFFSYRGTVPNAKYLKWDIVAFSEKV
ncbi:MAG: hypothetical protein KDD70_16955 [Bdellovibrionales bacterium]|nr:hypothetical protein [Bdellovibrionales bacterium]